MVAQHDHALLSGSLAQHLRRHLFAHDSYRDDVVFAVCEHDRGWIRMDDTPIWNDRAVGPALFPDYPLLPKLILYRQGIDEVQQMNRYAALLCSLHYSSFDIFRTSTQPECVEFYRHELARQAAIRDEYRHIDEDTVMKHLRLLQLCDDMSLYVCFNRPGAAKADEFPWYVSGFPRSELFNPDEGKPLVARWLDEKRIAVEPSPFEHEFAAALRVKHVAKTLIRQHGIAAAYKNTEWTEQEVVFA
ncbi:hypothetical protein SD70_20010 [Gordoniibacillus kamchatkensis]|uniref:DUF3891 family protein n=1 Tax=Gordoniibacillus kamchatkensis TaxID=1590651 RepID=A0ABR5AEQ0_9BACL|nr:hypothetical protein SD70_20010 [Paenibacillus sp. VKM B-2647]